MLKKPRPLLASPTPCIRHTPTVSAPHCQLTAGIAHEIKNPLNFVNNFSDVSVELINELRQALAGASLDNKIRSSQTSL
ncbi:MAG: hypothetical protein WA309_16015, partial [Pseudolabrys sp.]